MPITLTERNLLKALAIQASKVLTHTLLLQKMWGIGQPHDLAKLWGFMSRLRRKIEDDPAQAH